MQAGNLCGTHSAARGLQVCHCEAPTGPWQSREGTCSSYKPPLKWCAPIASVAALSERHWQLQISVYPADRTGHQICHCEEAVGRRGNLGKALPEWERHRRPYTPPGLTVAALSERHAVWQSLRHIFCGARLPSLSLRGPNGAVAISGRHLQSVQAAVKMVCTDCVCSGARCTRPPRERKM